MLGYHVYILKSLSYPEKHYVGYTEDYEKRLIKHNEGGVKYTVKYRPWKLQTIISFEEKEKAQKFEKYLKS
ncbi:MAG: GIY-YIG nuclease family protein, partial [Melioribacteraceae bacterium]|nr:GIY-YIG nuclease family protein [Melioribacteraceae bacterium]